MIARTVRKPTTSRFSFRQLQELWIAAGGNRVEASYAAAIALAESGGNPRAEHRNANGTIDRGLWGVNSVHGKLSTTNVAGSAKAAVQIHKQDGWSAWTTYQNGAYKTYLTPQNLLSGIKQNEAIEPLTGLISKSDKQDEAVEKAVEKPKLPSFEWGKLKEVGLMLILVLAGALLFVYGVAVAVRPQPKMVPVPV